VSVIRPVGDDGYRTSYDTAAKQLFLCAAEDNERIGVNKSSIVDTAVQIVNVDDRNAVFDRGATLVRVTRLVSRCTRHKKLALKFIIIIIIIIFLHCQPGP